jgi:hypothetical protein
MPRREGLKPIGDSVKKIIEKIRKEREERQNRNKSIRTQPKLPGLKKGGAVEPEYTVKQEVKDRLKKENPKTSFLMLGLSPVTQYRKYKHRQNIKKERTRDDAKVKKADGGEIKGYMSGGMGIFSKKKAKAEEPNAKKESNEYKKKKRLEELKKEIGMKKGGNVKSPKPGTYDYYLLNRPKHSPAPVKPKMKEGGRVKRNPDRDPRDSAPDRRRGIPNLPAPKKPRPKDAGPPPQRRRGQSPKGRGRKGSINPNFGVEFNTDGPSRPGKKVTGYMVKKGGLIGGQKKLDANKDGKISGDDFKILRGKQNKMKGGGIAIKGTNFKGVY